MSSSLQPWNSTDGKDGGGGQTGDSRDHSSLSAISSICSPFVSLNPGRFLAMNLYYNVTGSSTT